MDLHPAGDITFTGKDINVYIYDKFEVVNNSYIPTGDWTEFGVGNCRAHFERKADYEKKQILRSITPSSPNSQSQSK